MSTQPAHSNMQSLIEAVPAMKAILREIENFSKGKLDCLNDNKVEVTLLLVNNFAESLKVEACKEVSILNDKNISQAEIEEPVLIPQDKYNKTDNTIPPAPKYIRIDYKAEQKIRTQILLNLNFRSVKGIGKQLELRINEDIQAGKIGYFSRLELVKGLGLKKLESEEMKRLAVQYTAKCKLAGIDY